MVEHGTAASALDCPETFPGHPDQYPFKQLSQAPGFSSPSGFINSRGPGSTSFPHASGREADETFDGHTARISGFPLTGNHLPLPSNRGSRNRQL